jgi:hypothetical protein
VACLAVSFARVNLTLTFGLPSRADKRVEWDVDQQLEFSDER